MPVVSVLLEAQLDVAANATSLQMSFIALARITQIISRY